MTKVAGGAAVRGSNVYEFLASLAETSRTRGEAELDFDQLTLERDGASEAGFVLRYGANPGNNLIACLGINGAGTAVNTYQLIPNPGAGGTLVVYDNSLGVVHFRCSFGNAYSNQNMTEVTLSRHAGDNFWVGTVTSSAVAPRAVMSSTARRTTVATG